MDPISLLICMQVKKRWMQDSEGLWEIEPEDEEKILNYLEKYYGEKYDTRRRIPLAIFLQNKTH